MDARPPKRRLDAVDLIRGAVMIIMALDHVRDFFTSVRFEPTDLSKTWPQLFFTRWITHFCAPVFVFLAGTGAFLSRRPKKDLAWFLLTRGLWLVLLELTVVRFGWFFNVDYHLVVGQVIWAIGWSMVVLAGLVFLPVRVVGAIGLAIIASHHLLDGIKAHGMDASAGLWRIVHEQGPFSLGGKRMFFVAYPLVPWIGVMAAGYAFGSILEADVSVRKKRLAWIGAGVTLAFVVLRAINHYVDPQPWSAQPTAMGTVMSFLNATKYPPSIAYLTMTLGPAILALAALDRDGPMPRVAAPIVTLGRVPLFYYVLHLPLIHIVSLVLAKVQYGTLPKAFFESPFGGMPDDWGWGLPVVYLIWALVVVALLPACAWYAKVKARSKSPWLSYL